MLAAYRRGMFPMHLDADAPLGWWSPDPRGVFLPGRLHVSRSLRRSVRRFEIRVDTDFDGVIDGCADRRRAHGWINDDIRSAYRRLFDLGWAHTVETWQDGRLVGGLYGLSIGGLFAGESMFHYESDASKVALVALTELLAEDGVDRLVDVQWSTDHLMSLGATAIERGDYLERLARHLTQNSPPAFT